MLAIVASWNAFLLPLVVLNDPDMWTLPLGATNFSTQYSSDTARVLAFTSLSMVPALVFYVIAERQIVSGLASGARQGLRPSTRRDRIMRTTRITLVAVAVGVGMLGWTTAPAAPAAPAIDAEAVAGRPQASDLPLRELVRPNDLRIGTAVDMAALAADATYRERIAHRVQHGHRRERDEVGGGRAQPGQLRLLPPTSSSLRRERNSQQVRGHTLLWHNQLPAWLTGGVESGEIGADELRGILRQHITDEVGHFRGRDLRSGTWSTRSSTTTAQLRDTLWLRELGPGYIADAFRWAHKADPKAKLYPQRLQRRGRQRQERRLLRAGQAAAARRGCRCTASARRATSACSSASARGNVAANLQPVRGRWAWRPRSPRPTCACSCRRTPSKLQAQAQGYSALLQGCLLVRRCTSFTVWGFTDKYSWVPGFFEGEGAANILDENFAPKPAYQALQATLALALARPGGGRA